MDFLKGYKSIIGAIGAVATFVALTAQALADGFQMGDITVIMGGFSAMMLAIGLTGKAIDIQNSIKK